MSGRGRPKVAVKRYAVQYPPPNPQLTPCRIWQGALDRDGYGVYSPPGSRQRMRAHRWAWVQANGPIPAGMVVRHKCDNRPCYRVSHLELGTVAQNNEDARKRGHLGPVQHLSPSELRYLFAQRDAGTPYLTIFREWPGGCPVARSTLWSSYTRNRDLYDDDYELLPPVEPPPPPTDPVTNYRSWRDDDTVRPRAVRRLHPDPPRDEAPPDPAPWRSRPRRAP